MGKQLGDKMIKANGELSPLWNQEDQTPVHYQQGTTKVGKQLGDEMIKAKGELSPLNIKPQFTTSRGQRRQWGQLRS